MSIGAERATFAIPPINAPFTPRLHRVFFAFQAFLKIFDSPESLKCRSSEMRRINEFLR